MLAWVVIGPRPTRRATRNLSPLRVLCLRIKSPGSFLPAFPFVVPCIPVRCLDLSPLFAILTQTAGCVPKIPILELSTACRPKLSPTSYPLSFHILSHFFALSKTSTHLLSCASALFAKKHGGAPPLAIPPAGSILWVAL